MENSKESQVEAVKPTPKKTLLESLIEVKRRLKKPTLNKKVDVKTKYGSDYSYSYTTLDNLIDTIQQAIGTADLSWIQIPISSNGQVGVHTYLISSDDKMDCGEFLLPAGNGIKDKGSALTYARRYALSSIFGVSSESDSDGRQSSEMVTGPSAHKLSQSELEKYVISFRGQSGYLVDLWADAQGGDQDAANWFRAELISGDAQTQMAIRQLIQRQRSWARSEIKNSKPRRADTPPSSESFGDKASSPTDEQNSNDITDLFNELGIS